MCIWYDRHVYFIRMCSHTYYINPVSPCICDSQSIEFHRLDLEPHAIENSIENSPMNSLISVSIISATASGTTENYCSLEVF